MSNQVYHIEHYGIERKLIEDSLYLSAKVIKMVTFFEMDITELRNKIKAYKKSTKTNISIITVFLYCYAQTLAAYKRSHALKNNNNKLYLFEEADIFFPFEIQGENEQKKIARKIFKKATGLSLHELADELNNMQTTTGLLTAQEKRFMLLPKFIRHWLYNYHFKRPLNRKALFGNAYFSAAVNMVTHSVTAFSLPIHFHPIGMFISPSRINNEKGQSTTKIGITVSADHAIINGADLGRFCNDFIARIEQFSFT